MNEWMDEWMDGLVDANLNGKNEQVNIILLLFAGGRGEEKSWITFTDDLRAIDKQMDSNSQNDGELITIYTC